MRGESLGVVEVATPGEHRAGSCPADGAAPPGGAVRGTLTLPLVATSIVDACQVLAASQDGTASPRTKAPLRDARRPPFP